MCDFTVITLFYLFFFYRWALPLYDKKKFMELRYKGFSISSLYLQSEPGRGGGGVEVLPYKGLMGTCGQARYVFRDFCLKQDIDFFIFCLKKGIFF